MSVKREATQRRSTEIEVELPGTPEEVWHAIATGPGISSWFVPAEVDEIDGKAVTMKLSFGPGMVSSSTVTAWDPPRMFIKESPGWVPGSPPIATEWTVEARSGGTCVVRIVHSLFASTDDWDSQLESTETGWGAFLATLRLYLQHFSGQRVTMMEWMVPAAGTEEEAWEKLTAALGLNGVKVGQRWSAAAGAPAAKGIVEYDTDCPYDTLVRLEGPATGIAAFGTANFGQTMVGARFYLYGDQAQAAVARETPRWQAWFAEHFPAPKESN